MHLINRTLPCILLLALAGCKDKKSTLKPEWKALAEAVYASGYVAPLDEYKVFALADGYMLEKNVMPGDEVKAGQVMARIDALQQEQRLLSSKQMLEVAQSNAAENSPVLKELRAILSSVKARRDNDSLTYLRIKNLFDNGVSTTAELDKARLAYRVSSNDYEAAIDRLRRTEKQVKADFQNASSQYEISRKDHDFYSIKSLIDGRVYETYKERGELVRRGEPIALLGHRNKMYLQLSVDEQDIGKIKSGQGVLVKTDGEDARRFHARVTRVYPMERKQDQSFRVDAELTDTASTLFAGMSVEANIIISSKDKALVIPRTYLAGKDSVWVQRKDDEVKIRVKRGIENFDFVEIVSGLNEDDLLIKK